MFLQPSKQQRAFPGQSTSAWPTLQQLDTMPLQLLMSGRLLMAGQSPWGIALPPELLGGRWRGCLWGGPLLGGFLEEKIC